jgi:hypothetical protein
MQSIFFDSANVFLLGEMLNLISESLLPGQIENEARLCPS